MEMLSKLENRWGMDKLPLHKHRLTSAKLKSAGPQIQLLLRKQQELLRMFSLKCDKTLIKQIIFKTNGQSSREWTGSLSHSKLQSSSEEPHLCWYDTKILQTVSTSKNHTILYHPYLAHTHWLFTQLISSLEVCHSSEQQIKNTKQLKAKWTDQRQALQPSITDLDGYPRSEQGKSRMVPPQNTSPPSPRGKKNTKGLGNLKTQLWNLQGDTLWANSLRPGALTNTMKHPHSGPASAALMKTSSALQGVRSKQTGSKENIFLNLAGANQPIYHFFKIWSLELGFSPSLEDIYYGKLTADDQKRVSPFKKLTKK